MRRPETERNGIGRAWLGLAVGSLVLAGLLALFLVVGRLPPLDAAFRDPGLFRRCLVVHVDLSLVVWFHAFMGLLAALWLPGRAGRTAPIAAAAGVAAICGAGLLSTAAPVLSNYVPAIDSPLFLAGLALFGLALGLHLGRHVLARGPAAMEVPAAARTGLRTAGLAYLLALSSFAISALLLPAGLAPAERYELLFWGGGHVLQLATEAAMAACWIVLLGSALGRSPVGPRTGRLLFGALLAPWLISPVLSLAGPGSWQHRLGFTRLMQWGLFPAVTVLLVLCLVALRRARREGRFPERGWADPRLLGFAASAGLTVLGFVLGACIRGSNTIVPAHYHAAIGAVTAAFMATTWALLKPLGLRLPGARLQRLTAWQPALFAGGQSVFALGFAFAGAHGAERKVYGAEQAGRTLAESVGLGVMGLGGLVAVAGGLIFLWAVLAAFLDAHRPGATLGGRRGERRPWQASDPATDGQPLAAARAGLPDPHRVLHALGSLGAHERGAGTGTLKTEPRS